MCALQMAVNETELKQWVAEQLFCVFVSLPRQEKSQKTSETEREKGNTHTRTHRYLSFSVCEYTHLI